MVTTLPVNTGPRRARSLGARVGLGALSLLVASVTAISLDATTLAVIRTHNQVIIAGDSLLVWYGGDRRSQLTCKLDVRDDVVFAMAGLVVSPENDFDVQQLMHLVLKTPGTLEERTVVLERLVQGRLLGTLAAVRDGVAYLEMRDFYADVAPDHAVRLRVNRVNCPRECPRPTEVFGVGETAAMMTYLAGLPELPDALPALAEQMVELEIADRPALVEPPVDIVRAGASGIEWLHRKPACAG